MKAMVSLKGVDSMTVMNYICDNYIYLGCDHRVYTCTVALQYLFITGRLDQIQHNYIKSLSSSKLFSAIKKIAEKKGNEMFAYNQNHFESEWLTKLKLINN